MQILAIVAAATVSPVRRWLAERGVSVELARAAVFGMLALLFGLGVIARSFWGPDAAGTLFLTSSPEATRRAVAGTDAGPRDLDGIRASGVIRILARRGASSLHVTAAEESLIAQYARALNVTPEWVGAPAGELFDRLRNGEGDIVLGAAARDAERGVEYSLPWGVARHQVVSRTDTGRIRSEADLFTREIAVKRSSPVYRRLAELAGRHPSMEIVIVPEHVSVQAMLEQVATGRYDLAVADSMSLEPLLQRYLDLSIAFDLTRGEPRSWAVRGDSPGLLGSLNEFLNRRHLETELARIYREDLPELQQRKVLRLITFQNPANYYFDRGRLRGFEYELVRRFADEHRMRLDVVIAHSHEEMRRLLLEGRGDLIAAGVPEGGFGEARFASTRTANFIAPVLVGRQNGKPLAGPRDLDGRRVVLPPESPYREFLTQLQRQGIEFEIADSDPDLNIEGTLFRVARGMYDLTVIGSHQVKAELARQIGLEAHFVLSEPVPAAWVVRRPDTQLRAALNDYLSREFRKGYYNVLYSKYIENPQAPPADAGRLADRRRLSPWDEIVHEYADRYDFDWRLIVAQMYQESHFDPDALSSAGASGLMQILPTTAEFMGAGDINDPRGGIEAGIRYLDHLRGLFEEDLLLEDRTWFTLAAYNAGPQRVQRARRLAAEMNLDQDRWFDNVEKAMLRLARPYEKDGETVRDCRCGQTVVYVRDIRTRYTNYVRLTQTLRTAAVAAPAIRGG
jgi:membrane-bound lytic murein transglycosylase F